MQAQKLPAMNCESNTVRAARRVNADALFSGSCHYARFYSITILCGNLFRLSRSM